MTILVTIIIKRFVNNNLPKDVSFDFFLYIHFGWRSPTAKKTQWFLLRSVTFILLDCLCLFTNTCVHYVRLSPLIYSYILGLALIIVTHAPLHYTHLTRCYATLNLAILFNIVKKIIRVYTLITCTCYGKYIHVT